MEGDFRVGDWLVRPNLNQIEREGEERSTEPKVMDVFCYLARHAGEVLSKDRIIQAVWADTFVTDDALKYAIVNLRKALEDDPRSPRFIRTIPRRGYQLIAPVQWSETGADERYTVGQPLGQGAMGEVFLGEDKVLKRRVALKFLRENLEQDEEARKQLVREARAAAALDHPYICKIYDTGQLQDRTFIAMEYVEGRTLKDRLAEGPLPPKEALRIAFEVAESLEIAAEQGIVHRDIKPSNIMLTRQGHVKVTDFGVAKRLPSPTTSPGIKGDQDWTATLTEEISTKGTLPYMSPEQLRLQQVDHRTDIFSLGVVLYEMLNGVNPFYRPTEIETAGAILEMDLPIADSPETPGASEFIVRRMLAKNPSDRCSTAREVRAALDEIIENSSVAVSQKAAMFTIPKVPRWLATALAPALAALALLVWWYSAAPANEIPAPLKITPFTSFPGDECDPAFSPDGSQIAFTWCPGPDNCDIWVQVVGIEAPKQLTFHGNAFSPAWSPDGRYIAFVRFYDGGDGGKIDILRIPSTGGPEKRLGESFQDRDSWPGLGKWLSWYPDSQALAVRFANSDEPLSCIARLSTDGEDIKPLSHPPNGCKDFDPAISPDGQTLIFARYCGGDPGGFSGDPGGNVYRLPLQGGSEEPLMPEGLFYEGLAWTPDGSYIVYTQGFPMLAAGHQLYKIPVSGGKPELLFSENGSEATVSPQGNLLAFVQISVTADIWEIQLPDSAGQSLIRSKHPVSSTYFDGDVELSPDGEKVAFISERRGSRQIYVADRDGSNPVGLTDLDHALTSTPAWSPDGRRIAFHSMDVDSKPIAWVIGIDGSGLRQLSENATNPTWSRDGKWIYFVSRQSGELQVYKLPTGSEKVKNPVPIGVTQGGGGRALESLDGRFLYYRREAPELWRKPVGGGEEELILNGVESWIGWTIGKHGIYYIDYQTTPPLIKHFDINTKKTNPIAELDEDCFGLTVSSDGSLILYSRYEQGNRDIMLVENFH